MGLAPMHTWKPDAYGEAPGIIGALLAGGMTNCAFLALLRVYRVMQAAGEGAFARELFLALGLLSMGVAAAFMVGQRDFKRMLAYSSVEHMGILVIGIGAGGIAVPGALLHVINNSLTKVVLFLSAGNIHRAYGSKTIDAVSGAFRRVPLSAVLFLAGFLAITGSPPFGPFISEFTILVGAMTGHLFVTAALFLVLPRRHLHRHGLDGPRGRPGADLPGGGNDRLSRQLLEDRADAGRSRDGRDHGRLDPRRGPDLVLEAAKSLEGAS